MEIELSRLTAIDLVLQGRIALPEAVEGGGVLEADGIRFPEPFETEVRARRTRDDQILVAGHAEGAALLECGRCLEWFRHPIALDFESRFCEAGPAQPRADRHAVRKGGLEDEDEPRLGPADEDVVQLPAGTRALPVGEVVREQVLVDLPLRPLCRPDCAGLCPRCGGNRNESACTCPAEDDGRPTDLRLAELAELRKRLERQ